MERKINSRLQELRKRGSIDDEVYQQLRVSQNCTRPALFYGLPKIHKPNAPLRPIVSYVNHALYATSKYLAKLLSPFSRTFPSFVQDSTHLCEILKDVEIDNDHVLVSFDVKSLYTSVPIDRAMESVRSLLESDQSWKTMTDLTAEEVLDLLSVCLKESSFKYRDRFYHMTSGLAMGSPVSPVVANIFVSQLEQSSIATLTTKPRLWLRFVNIFYRLSEKFGLIRHCATSTVSMTIYRFFVRE